MAKSNFELVQLIESRASSYLDSEPRNKNILEAMRKVDRMNFLPSSVKNIAYQDTPLPIGYGQTCSQPSMVAFMLDKLEIKKGNTILEIGAGCGYAAAIASLLCQPTGIVYASEIIPELAEIMRMNLAQYMEKIIIISEDGSAGFLQYAPFDRIFISAGVTTRNFNEKILLSQLADNGILLYPESYGNIYKVSKISEDNYDRETYHGVSFVPLRGQNA
jgi:protein-L-isoaspartate(D-aspartate) O-methyltransferase